MDPLGYLLEEATDNNKLIEFLEKTEPLIEEKKEEPVTYETKEEFRESIIKKMENIENAEFITNEAGNRLEHNSYEFENIKLFGVNEILTTFLKRNPVVIPTKQTITEIDDCIIREQPYNAQLYRSNLIIAKYVKTFLQMLNKTGLSFIKYNNKTDAGILQNFDVVVISPYQLKKYTEIFESKCWNRVIIMTKLTYRLIRKIDFKFVTRWYFTRDKSKLSMIYQISEIGTKHLFKPILIQKISYSESDKKASEKKIILHNNIDYIDYNDLGSLIAIGKEKYDLGHLQFLEKYIQTLKTNTNYEFNNYDGVSLPKFTNEKIENYILDCIKTIQDKIEEDKQKEKMTIKAFEEKLCQQCGHEGKEMYFDFNVKKILCVICREKPPRKLLLYKVDKYNEWELRNIEIDYINFLLGDSKIPDYFVGYLDVVKDHKRIPYPEKFTIRTEYDIPKKHKILIVSSRISYNLKGNGILYFDHDTIVKFVKSESGILVLNPFNEIFDNMDLSFCTDLITDIDIGALYCVLKSLMTINRTFPLVIHYL